MKRVGTVRPPAGAPPDRRRLRANRFGRRAEWVALFWLCAKGYWPLALNYTVRGGEIDLIVQRGRTVVFVEVKARPGMEQALGAISPAKIRRIRCAARVWLARNPQASNFILRGDGVFISPNHLPCHIEDAFGLDLF